MKCPECIKEGKRSIVTEDGCFSTGMYSPPTWDEEGNRIDVNINITTINYSCSNGHNWSEES